MVRRAQRDPTLWSKVGYRKKRFGVKLNARRLANAPLREGEGELLALGERPAHSQGPFCERKSACIGVGGKTTGLTIGARRCSR